MHRLQSWYNRERRLRMKALQVTRRSVYHNRTVYRKRQFAPRNRKHQPLQTVDPNTNEE